MKTKWIDQILSNAIEYVHVAEQISMRADDVVCISADQLNELDKFSNKRIVVIDDSDATLMVLLHRSQSHKLYLLRKKRARRAINITKLRNRLMRMSNLISLTSFRDLLFLLPLVYSFEVDGLKVPSLVCLQGNLTVLFAAISNARGKISVAETDTGDAAIDLGAFLRVITHIAKQEEELTAKLVKILRDNEHEQIYDPTISSMENYIEGYYAEDGFITTDDELRSLVLDYIQGLIEVSKYNNTLRFDVSIQLPDAPLAVTLEEIVRTISTKIEYLKSDKALFHTQIAPRKFNRL